ncbi:MAG: hypothetical protein K8R36_04875 [Planctomycetales bacterium]|nr:hypothetical protein [Planctomycetales bacterium]
MLRSGEVTDPDVFESVCHWQLCQITWFEELADAPKLREKVGRDLKLAGKARVLAAHDRLNTILLTTLPAIAQDESYHQGTRSNAMFLLGRLSQQEPDPVSKDPGEPLRKILPILLATVESPFKGGPKTNDVTRVAALCGLDRYSQYPFVNEELRQRLLTSLVKLAQQVVPPSGRTPEGHDWLRRRAIEIVGAAARGNETKTDAQAVSAIRVILVDHKASLKVRLAAAAAWAQSGQKETLAKGQLAPLLHAVTELAATVIDSQLIRGAKGRFDLKRDESRRVLAAQLWPLHAAAHTAASLPNSTPAMAKNPPEKSPATALADALQFCLKTIGSDEFSDRQVAQVLHDQKGSFPDLLGSESRISR